MYDYEVPTGRSSYQPGKDWHGPQSNPDDFSNEDIIAEIKYLIRLNMRCGSNVLRTSAYTKLADYLRDVRKYNGKI